MKIIQSIPNESGAYPPVQIASVEHVPDGWFQISDEVDTNAMQTHAGFVKLAISSGVVTEITGDDVAYQSYIASLPEPKEPEPDPVAVLAETVANLIYQLDVEKLSGGTTL